jgi:hypothetical protein
MMESLEDILKKIEMFGKDLTAEKVLQEEKSHTENVTRESYSHSIWDTWVEEETVIDQPRIAELDIEKREKALVELEEIYQYSEWYSARYAAGSTLGKDITKDIPAWCANLEKRSWCTVQEKRNIRYWNNGDDVEWGHWEFFPESFTIVDKKERFRALNDAIALLKLSGSEKVSNLLFKVYESTRKELLAGGHENVNDTGYPLNEGFIESMREEAGKALGYSKMRVWARNNEDKVALAAAGITGSIIYALVNYLGR